VSWRDTRFSSKKLHEEQKTKVNQMKLQAKKRALKKKLEEAARIAKEIKEKEESMNPTSLRGLVSHVQGNGDVEMGVHGAL
jgi:hypothetical protein